MIGLLDPALFLPRTGEDAEAALAKELDLVLRTCRLHTVHLPPFPEYWPDLWRLGRDLDRSLTRPDAKAALRELRRLGDLSSTMVAGPAPEGKVWRKGFAALFDWPPLDHGWEERMAEAAVRAAIAAAANRERVVLLVRRVPSRNVKVHSAGKVELHENTRWMVYIQPRRLGPQAIPCVHHPRNIGVAWTTRFDWRLSADSKSARYPFCRPDRWWSGETIAWRTVQGKPAWLDAQDNGWCRPNIPGGAGYHWDVFVRVTSLSEALGVDQINVVQFGAPASEGAPGHLHHIPSKKSGRVRDCGWDCQ